MKFVATKNGKTTNFLHLSLLLFFLDPGWVKSGSGIRDKHPGSATLNFSKQKDLGRHRALGTDAEIRQKSGARGK